MRTPSPTPEPRWLDRERRLDPELVFCVNIFFTAFSLGMLSGIILSL